MPFDLMAHNREIEGKGEAVKRPFRSSSSSSVGGPAEDARKQEEAKKAAEQLEALRKLEALQIASAPAKPKPRPPPKESSALPVRTADPSSPPRARLPTGEWVCRNCSKTRQETHGDCTCPADFKFCPTCGESEDGTPSEKVPPSRVDDDWDCNVCGESNSKTFFFCVECGAAALEPPPPPPKACVACGEGLSDMFKYCPDCGTDANATEAEKKEVQLADDDAKDWTCTKCGDEMPGGFNYCHECGIARK